MPRPIPSRGAEATPAERTASQWAAARCAGPLIDLRLPNERPRPNVPRRGVARPSAPPVPMVPVLLRLRNRGTAPVRDVGPDPRPARPSRRPAELKFIFGAAFEPAYRGPAAPLDRPPVKFIFGAAFEPAYRGPAAPLDRPPVKFIFGAAFEPAYRGPAAPLDRPPVKFIFGAALSRRTAARRPRLTGRQ